MKTISKIIFTVLMLITISGSLKAQYVSNKAAVFNGETSYISLFPSQDVDLRNGFTIEAWVYYEYRQGKTNTIYFDKGGIQLAINGSGNLVFTYSSTGTALLDPFPIEEWTHVAATYDGATIKVYINGELHNSIVTSGTIPAPGENAFVGGVWNQGTVFNSFKGMLDDVRVWTEVRSYFNIYRDIYMSLGVLKPTGTYSKLGLSYRFDSNGGSFIADEGGALPNYGNTFNITYKDYTNKITRHGTFNSSLVLEGAGSYCVAPHHQKLDASSALTLESWVKLGFNGPHSEVQEIVSKGNSQYSYRMYMKYDSTAVFKVNAGSGYTVEYKVANPFSWNHIAGTYNGQTGEMKLYVNGDLAAQNVFAPAGIQATNDSLYIGKSGSIANSEFKGQLDEIRVWSEKVRSPQEIKKYMHLGINTSSQPAIVDALVYGFDGRADDVTQGGYTNTPTALGFHGYAYMRSARANAPIYSASPLIWHAPGDFLDNTWNLSQNRKSVPANTVAYDSIYYASNGTVQEAKLMVLMNTANVHKVKLTLISPNGTSIQLTPEINSASVKCDLMTVFSDDADSVISYEENSMAPFSPSFKPFSMLSALNGKERKGWWKLKIETGDIGSASNLVKWGIQNSILTGTDPVTHTPDSYSLEQNYPNPFNPATTISFNIGKPGFTSLKVYDILGKEVANLVNQNMNAGSHSINFNASALPSGVYFYKLETDGFTDVKKMSLIK